MSIFRIERKRIKKRHPKGRLCERWCVIIKAIDVLFYEIDKINSQIKLEKDTYKRVLLAFEIEKIVGIIRGLEELQSEEYLPTTKRTY